MTEPFFTTRRGQGGTGLGLNIVFNLIAKQFGGTITVSSTLGQGATFLLRLPTVTPLPDSTAMAKTITAKKICSVTVRSCATTSTPAIAPIAISGAHWRKIPHSTAPLR